MDSYDLAVLGGGPGGLSAAIRAARRGARVCLIEAGALGGTCLNRGCIPSRALGTTARLLNHVRKASSLGIRIDGTAQIDLAAVLVRKERIVRRLRSALSQLLEKSSVTCLAGEGILQGPHEIEVKRESGALMGLQAKAIILATGSRPASVPGCPIDGKRVVTSDHMLELSQMPDSLLVVGAGVIGCEFASYFADLGSRVILLEAADRILPSLDPSIADVFRQSLEKKKVTVYTNKRFESFSELSVSLILVAAGRSPLLPPGTEALGLHLKDGGLPVDSHLRTRIPSIFAIGDLLGKYQLACTASYEGACAAENAMGESQAVTYEAVPDVIFTEPEIACVGLAPEEARQKGIPVTVSRVPLSGFPRALTLEETEGFAQVVADKKSGRLLGAQLMGPRATDLIGEATLAIRKGLTLQDLTETLHGHPTMSESVWEAAAAALNQSVYYAVREP